MQKYTTSLCKVNKLKILISKKWFAIMWIVTGGWWVFLKMKYMLVIILENCRCLPGWKTRKQWEQSLHAVHSESWSKRSRLWQWRQPGTSWIPGGVIWWPKLQSACWQAKTIFNSSMPRRYIISYGLVCFACLSIISGQFNYLLVVCYNCLPSDLCCTCPLVKVCFWSLTLQQ